MLLVKRMSTQTLKFTKLITKKMFKFQSMCVMAATLLIGAALSIHVCFMLNVNHRYILDILIYDYFVLIGYVIFLSFSIYRTSFGISCFTSLYLFLVYLIFKMCVRRLFGVLGLLSLAASYLPLNYAKTASFM